MVDPLTKQECTCGENGSGWHDVSCPAKRNPTSKERSLAERLDRILRDPYVANRAMAQTILEARDALSGDSSAPETSRELERLRELQEKALALDDAVAEFGIDKPQYIAEVYQAFHDVLHDGHGSPSVVKTLVEVRAFGTSIDPPSQKASTDEVLREGKCANCGKSWVVKGDPAAVVSVLAVHCTCGHINK